MSRLRDSEWVQSRSWSRSQILVSPYSDFILYLKAVYGADLEEGLAGTFIAAMFEEADNDEYVMDIRNCVDQQYPAITESHFTVE